MIKVKQITEVYENLKDDLNNFPFILIIGKYDHFLGPRTLFSSIPSRDDHFIRNLLRDALNSKLEYIFSDFGQFYSQTYKIEVENSNPKGGKQLYAIIILRDVKYPLITILHFKRILKTFYNINHDKILFNDLTAFQSFFKEISNIYT